jgi:molecular chaperone GrpE (heat shock protein)
MFRNILFWITKGKRVEQLIREVAMQANDLSGLPTSGSGINQQDPIKVLQSTSTLLESLKEQQEANPHSFATTYSAQANASESASEQSILITPEQRSISISATSAGGKEQELSATAKDLMKLSDWVLLAKVGKTSVQPEILEEIYRQITIALTKEGVTLLNVDGLFDYERQKIVATQPTDDPALDDQICKTIRPGFLFNEQLIRPQEVIVYVTR